MGEAQPMDVNLERALKDVRPGLYRAAEDSKLVVEERVRDGYDRLSALRGGKSHRDLGKEDFEYARKWNDEAGKAAEKLFKEAGKADFKPEQVDEYVTKVLLPEAKGNEAELERIVGMAKAFTTSGALPEAHIQPGVTYVVRTTHDPITVNASGEKMLKMLYFAAGKPLPQDGVYVVDDALKADVSKTTTSFPKETLGSYPNGTYQVAGRESNASSPWTVVGLEDHLNVLGEVSGGNVEQWVKDNVKPDGNTGLTAPIFVNYGGKTEVMQFRFGELVAATLLLLDVNKDSYVSQSEKDDLINSYWTDKAAKERAEKVKKEFQRSMQQTHTQDAKRKDKKDGSPSLWKKGRFKFFR
ncbi:hypothetical protein HYU14_02810 [Candidatus Woesearchaeota archaeon]|nr:hypothetical protein [Candidatus Woesearchaeota archaeon]